MNILDESNNDRADVEAFNLETLERLPRLLLFHKIPPQRGLYTPNGGEVMVGLGKFNDQARLTIRDNGPGIPAEDLPHVFERFYRGEKSRTRSREGKGFGLGLSIAYWIVRNHGGRIEVDSKEGVGTTFGVWLPLSKDGCKK